MTTRHAYVPVTVSMRRDERSLIDRAVKSLETTRSAFARRVLVEIAGEILRSSGHRNVAPTGETDHD